MLTVNWHQPHPPILEEWNLSLKTEMHGRHYNHFEIVEGTLLIN